MDTITDSSEHGFGSGVAMRAYRMLDELGSIAYLMGRTIVSAATPPYNYGPEFADQCRFILKLCWFPLLVSTIVFGYAAPGLQGGNFLRLFGSVDRLGGVFVIGSIREFAPFVTAVVVAGVAGTAITADLGARVVREELDALVVLGVNPVRSLVVPRFLALMLMTGLLDVFALIFGIVGGVLATISFNAPLAPFFATLLNNASTTDLWGSLAKTTVFGMIVAIVHCYKGMTVSGGPEGVGRAVNRGAVISLMAVFAFNSVFTQVLLATHPSISKLK
jgi:phospholipid/cholesterol/gamma-HCH transport system permease protein